MLEEGKNGLSSKKYKKSWVLENNISKKYIPLQSGFLKQLIVLRFKSKENEKISFDGRSYRSGIFRILW